MYSLFYTLVLVFCVADGQSSQNGYNYEMLVQGSIKLHPPAKWRDARAKCYEEGAELASPYSFAVEENMLQVMQRHMHQADTLLTSNVFTGIHDTYSSGHFQTVDGKRIRVDLMAGPKPENITGPTCVAMQYNGKLGYAECTDRIHFLCYRREPDCGPVGSGYKYVRSTGSCYKPHIQELSWSRAYGVCADEDAHLAIINSDTEVKVLQGLMNNVTYQAIHVGFSDWKDHRTWMTVDGRTIKDAGYERWASGEPNNVKQNQYCGSMYTSGLLDDLNCDNEPYYFICEKNPA